MPWKDPAVARIKKREYRARNIEKWRAYARRKAKESREKHKNEPLYRERARRWGREAYYRNRDNRLAQVKSYRMANEKIINEKKKAYYAANPHVRQKATRNWYLKTRAESAAKEHRRRIQKNSKSDGTAEAFYTFVRLRKSIPCYYCGKRIAGKDAHIDHVIAVSKQGNHASDNLAASCASCNLKKGSKMPNDFVVENQPLLNL